MLATDRLLAIVKQKGPVVPADVAKEINQNLLFASAMLSELASRKLVRISHLKIGGGSPLYYTEEQYRELARFIKNLDEKEQRAVEYLRSSSVLRDSDLTPLLRVSLSEAKDFAVPLEVKTPDRIERFWKWYLCTDEEAAQKIEAVLKQEQSMLKQEQLLYEHEKEKEIERQRELVKQKEIENDTSKITSKVIEEVKKEKTKKEKRKLSESVEQEIVELKKPALKKVSRQRPALSPQTQLPKTLQDSSSSSSLSSSQPLQSKNEIHESSDFTSSEPVEKEKHIKKITPFIQGPAFLDTSEFYTQLSTYFETRNISSTSQRTVRFSREYECIAHVPTPVGQVSFFCIAKNKKTLTSGDFAEMYLLSQEKKFPLLVLTNAQISKKTKQFLEKELRGVAVAQLSDTSSSQQTIQQK